jgi:hypothetical protein
VWWDHTIPPGKTWDTHIAAAIESAKACIVVWSARSVGSDWVKEEATLARDADKFLPVALDASLPPVGFRRIQAAQMAGWTGDRTHPQFQLLVREVRALSTGVRPAYAPPPQAAAPAPGVEPAQAPVYAPAPAAAPIAASTGPGAPSGAASSAPRAATPWGILAGVGAGALLGLIVVLFLVNQTPTPAAAPATTAPAAAPATAAPLEGVDEAQRLIDERDEALKRAEDARALTEQQEIAAALAEEERRAEEQRLAQERARNQSQGGYQSAGGAPGVGAFLGEWALVRTDSGSGCPEYSRLRMQGSRLIWDYAPEGQWRENLSSDEYTITANGRLEFQPPGGVYWGELRNGQLTLNQMYSTCTFTRAR